MTEIVMYTGPQVAELLKISVPSAYRLMRIGEIKTVHIGERIVRVRKEDLEKYIEERVS